MSSRRIWLLCAVAASLPGLSAAQTSSEAPAADTPAVRDLFRWVELNAGPAVAKALKAGQDPNVLSERGQRPLHWALMHESGRALEALLADARTDPNSRNASDEKPVWLAALRGRLDWVKALIARGAQLERSPQPEGARAWTTLHYAATGPNLELVQWLIDQGCDLNAGSTNGSTPLMLALGYGSLDAARLLLEAGADVRRSNDLGLRADDFARRAGRVESLQRMGLWTRLSEKN